MKSSVVETRSAGNGKRIIRSSRERGLGFKGFIIQAPKLISDFDVHILLKNPSSVVQYFHRILDPRKVKLQLHKFKTHVGRAGSGLSDNLPKLL